VDFPRLQAKGLELEAGNGSILLLSPAGDQEKVVRFLAQRGDGVIGASIEVASLEACKRVFENSGVLSEACNDLHEESRIVGPNETYGISLEFYQRH
jgi:hypothetical protein